MFLIALVSSVLAGCKGVATVYEVNSTAAPLESIRARVTEIIQRIGDEHAITPPHSINEQIFIILRKHGEDGGYTGIYALELNGIVRVHVSDWPPGGGPGITRRIRFEAQNQLKDAFGDRNVVVRNTERFTQEK